jgi:hypothetical protein
LSTFSKKYDGTEAPCLHARTGADDIATSAHG